MLMLTLDFSHSVCDEQKLYRNTFGDLQPLCNFQELGDIPPVFRPQHFEEIKELMEELSKCSYPNIPDCTRQARLIKELLLLILYDANKYNRKLENTPSNINPYVKKACEYIAENFDKNIDLDNLSDFVYLNKNYLIKLFNKELGQSPKQYLLEMRLLHARKLLLETNQSIQEIAFSCGFNTPSYFSKKFKNQYGVLPAAVRKKDFRI
jgi:AraC-like DNA-binding protein